MKARPDSRMAQPDLVARTEVGSRGDRAVLVRLLRRPGRQPDADVLEAASEDVRFVSGAVHPGSHDALWSRQRPLAPSDVLAHGPAPRPGQVPGPADPLGEIRATRALMVEVA